jgi:hypothetical protein
LIGIAAPTVQVLASAWRSQISRLTAKRHDPNVPNPSNNQEERDGANAGMQKGLMRHANISTTMNTYGRAAIKATQKRK